MSLVIGGAVIGGIVVLLAQLRSERRGGGSISATHFWRGFYGVSVPILLYALAYTPNIHYPLDLFHEGENVAPAQAILAGQIPYRDVVFVHGFLRDPGVALAAFRLFGPTIAGLRTLEQLLSPLALVATYYLALVCLGGAWALLYSLLALVGFIPMFYDWRIVPALAAIICLVLHVRRGSAAWVGAASILSFIALATSFDVGVVSVCSSAALIVARWFSERTKQMTKPLFVYSLPLLVCLSIVMLYFAAVNGLGPFLNWHLQILQTYRDWDGMPYPISAEGFIQVRDAFLSPLGSILAIVALSLVFVRKRWAPAHWVILLLLVSNPALFNRGVVSGYSGGYALEAGSQFAPLLLAVLLLHAADAKRQNRLQVPIAAALGLALMLPIPLEVPTQDISYASLPSIVNRLPDKNRITIDPSWVQSKIERIGPLYIPQEQERSLERVVAFLGKAESFWDFTDHGALFFLTNHTSPTRFYATHHVITGENQHEVINALALRPPEYVLYRSNTGWDAIAGVDRNLRSFLVAEYLQRNYHPVETVGGFVILQKGEPESYPVGAPFKVNLGYVPYLWGQDKSQILKSQHTSLVAQWSFLSASTLMGWETRNDIPLSETRPEGWHIRTSGQDPQLQNLDVEINPQSVTYLAISMTVAEYSTNRTSEEGAKQTLGVQLFWRSGNDSFTEEKSVLFNAVADGQDHLYLVRLASFPSWSWSGPVTGLRLDPGAIANVNVTIRSIEFLGVRE